MPSRNIESNIHYLHRFIRTYYMKSLTVVVNIPTQVRTFG